MAEAWSPFKGAVRWLGSVLGWDKLGPAYKRRDLRTDTKIHKVAVGMYSPSDVTPAGASAFSATVHALSTAVRTKYVSSERVLYGQIQGQVQGTRAYGRLQCRKLCCPAIFHTDDNPT